MKFPRTSVQGFELLGRSLYGLRRASRITDANSLLQALEWVPVGAEQSLEEANVVCGHGTPPLPSPNTLSTSFRPTNVGASKRLTLDWVPVSLKSKSWDWLGRFAARPDYNIIVRPLFKRVEKKEASYGAGRGERARHTINRDFKLRARCLRERPQFCRALHRHLPFPQSSSASRFTAGETGETVKARRRPIVVITLNNEKELPDAFLRRCFFHYIRFPDADTMRAIIDVHFPGIKRRLVSEALKLFTKSAPCEGGGLARASEPKAAVKPEHRAGISGRRR